MKFGPYVKGRPVSPHGRDMASLDRLKQDLYWQQFDKPTCQRKPLVPIERRKRI